MNDENNEMSAIKPSLDAEILAYHDVTEDDIIALLKRRASFTLTNVTSISQSARKIENLIEELDLSCRIYTAGRSASIAATFSPAFFVGAASAVAIAAHNLATINPDYEIAKFPLTDKLEINFKK